MSNVMTDAEQRIYNEFVAGRHALEHDLKDLGSCSARLLEKTKRGGRLVPHDLEVLGGYVTEVLLVQGRLSVLQELVDVMGLA